MRRILNVAVVAGVLAALAAVGAASSAPIAEPAVRQLAPEPWQDGRERVGTVEPVRAVLGYLDGDRSTTFRYPDAEYVKVHLARLALLPGDYLTVADSTGREVHRITGSGWATSVTGDTAVVTLHSRGLPLDVAGLGVTVDKVARGFRPDEAPSPREESVCGGDESRDAVCYRSSHPAIYQNTKPVARLLIDGVELCTAFRVGPTNRLLTNHHCVENSQQARRTEVWFNYQCAECDGWAVFRPTKVRADRVLDTDQTLDYTLFTVDEFDQIERFGYLELDPRSTQAGEELYVPQHPRGQPARVALRSDQDLGGSCAVSEPRVHGYGWYSDLSYYCDTDGGSSGSPVLSRRSHRVIALHHFGGCPNSGVRMELIHPRIANLL
jgi:lysyl endopeptidase